MHAFRSFLALSIVAVSTVVAARTEAPPPLVTFSGAIGVDPLTGAGGVNVTNTVRGVAPGGRAWVLRKLSASVNRDGTIVVKGKGLLLGSGESIGTRGGVATVGATLFCGTADANASKFSTITPFALDTFGNFEIRGPLSSDGINTAVLPDTCTNPVLLVRAANATTGLVGPWFAAGIPSDSDD